MRWHTYNCESTPAQMSRHLCPGRDLGPIAGVVGTAEKNLENLPTKPRHDPVRSGSSP
ncbi:hypothetical protein C884_01418 [Kocuria palustris PEL]|uniref:Uncharacterized protein n=1 Tax=Kocuria palustris PEL TaxID=1236550 RepID=M2X980_9MICC|nr:hypothetical protein C884_01418 [Kocuria palustris PEL]